MERVQTTSQERVTGLLTSWVAGDSRAGDRLFSTLYQELRRLARKQLRGRPDRVTLDTSGLIHEAYLKLVDGSRAKVRDRGHFFALSARIMRQIVVDHVRRRCSVKRGGADGGSPAIEIPTPLKMSPEDLLALEEALGKLKTLDPRAAELVDLRFFGGASIEQAAEILEVSITTAKRDWERTRAFLFKELKRQPSS